MKKDNLQTTKLTKSVCSARNACNSNIILAKWKGLDKIMVNEPILLVKAHAVNTISKDS